MEEHAELLYEGRRFQVFAIRYGERCPYRDFLREQKSAPDRQTKIAYWMRRLGDLGPPLGERKWHAVHRDANLFVLKPDPQIRLVCFLDREAFSRRIVITHGFIKTTDDIPPNEKEKALNARARYFEAKG